ncbi:MAG: metallophosphoesterase family protein [Candidatus Saccharibacteria bacterium]
MTSGRTAAKLAGIAVTAFLGAFLFVYLFGAENYTYQGVSVRVAVTPALHGQTLIEVPPLGRISADTHSTPLLLTLRLEEVETDAILKAVGITSGTSQILDDLQGEAHRVFWSFAVKQVLLGLMGALLLVLAVWRPGWQKVIVSGLFGALVISAWMSVSLASFDLKAFQEPEYKGAISLAPDVLRVASGSADNLNKFRDQANQVVSNIRSLFDNLDSMSALADPGKEVKTRKILLVSDLHSNPVGLQLIKALAHKFKVDFIIDAGDLTDMGSPLENQAVKDLSELGVPQLFSPGNHDNPRTVKFMSGLPKTRVFNSSTIVVDGIKILGQPDPLASSDVPWVKGDERSKMVEASIASLKAEIKKQGKPDILVVHDPSIANAVAVESELTVTGHVHNMYIKTIKDKVLINPGTIGAAGVRGLYSDLGAVYSAVIVYYDPGVGPISADLIKYDPMSRQFSLERHTLRK